MSSISKEHIEKRIKELEAERDQCKANLIAYEGAIQGIQALLKEDN